MSTRSGVERGSVAMYKLSSDQPVSDMFFNQERLIRAIIRLCASVVGHSHLAGVSQAVGTSISVGISTFSIVADLGFVGGRCHGFEQWLLAVLGLHLLHRLRKQEEALGTLKSWMSLTAGFTGKMQ